jgi:hypothetical protein
MPCRPRKCCGKKTMLTPMKVIQKCSRAEELVVAHAPHLLEPVVEAGEDREHRAEAQHIVEVGDDVVGVVQRVVDAGVGQHDAGDAADGEQEDEADAHSIGVLNSIEPPHMVAIHEKILMPVGTAMTMVAAMK